MTAQASSIVVQQPAQAARLHLLFHGVGATPESLLGLARWLAARDAGACVVSVTAPHASDMAPGGRQWFSVRGVTEDKRQARVDAAMPVFLDTVAHWQRWSGVAPVATALLGFSQGAIMALESTRSQPAAARVVAIAGRYAQLPDARPQAAIHLLHGTADGVMPVALAVQARERLQQLGAEVTLDTVDGAGHTLHPAMLAPLAQWF
jgi:phospholipase/carboxylesterase